MLALFGKTLDNATGGCFRRSDEICSEAPPVCTALIWRFGDGVESHISCHLAGLWPCSSLYSAVCSAHSPRAGLIGVIEYLWAQNRHLREKWEIHSFCWETWSSQTHTLETLDCTHTDRHTHTQTGTHTLTHSDTVTLIILEININLHTVKPTRGFLRIPVKLKRFWTCFCRCYQLCLGKGFISSKLRSTLQAFLSVLYSFQHFTSRCISPESRYLSHTVWRLNSQDKLWVRHFKNQVKIRNLAIRSFYLIPASHYFLVSGIRELLEVVSSLVRPKIRFRWRHWFGELISNSGCSSRTTYRARAVVFMYLAPCRLVVLCLFTISSRYFYCRKML